MDAQKVYTPEEIKKIAPGYRGKPENFDPTKIVKKGARKKAKLALGLKSTVPNVTLGLKSTVPKNNPLWADSIFGIDVSVRELDVNLEQGDPLTHTPSFAKLPSVIDEVWTAMCGDDKSLNDNLTKEMMIYYATSLLWARLLNIKAKRGTQVLSQVEQQFVDFMNEVELHIPQPFYLYLRAIGHVKDKTGKTVFLADHSLPVTAVQSLGGYHSTLIDDTTHNLYEEIPCLGVCGDALMLQENQGTGIPDIKVLPDNSEPTQNLCGYMGPVGHTKDEISMDLSAIGITSSTFDEIIPKTRLSMQLVQRVSENISRSETFKVEKTKMDSLTTEGDACQIIRSVPTDENLSPSILWTEKVIRPTSATAESTTVFGASYFTGFQLYKEPTGAADDKHLNWSCLKAKASDGSQNCTPWALSATAISNRNARRALPVEFTIDRFVSISDSQMIRTKAVVRRMIIAPR